MEKVGFIVNMGKEFASEISVKVVAWLNKNNIEVFLNDEAAKVLGMPNRFVELDEMCDQVDFILVLGGDGTLLRTARAVADKNIPFIGINLGHLGFLTELEVEKLFDGLEDLRKGNYRIEERMMLAAYVKRDGKIIKSYHALNDFVITKGAFARIIELEAYINEDYLSTYPADGLIISSPTGSTAYSLSAGGPIISPELEVIIITPICPHTLYARPVVVSHEQEVRVKIVSDAVEIMLTLDGQEGLSLKKNDEVVVKKSQFKAKLIKLKNRSFYDILREKLKDGGGSRV